MIGHYYDALRREFVPVGEFMKRDPKPKHRIPRECLDDKGNLKPESPCAKKMREAADK